MPHKFFNFFYLILKEIWEEKERKGGEGEGEGGPAILIYMA